jgi:hypothetical protein
MLEATSCRSWKRSRSSAAWVNEGSNEIACNVSHKDNIILGP